MIVKAASLNATQGLTLAWPNRSLASVPTSLTAISLLNRLVGLALPKEMVSYRSLGTLGTACGVETVKMVAEGHPQLQAVTQPSGGGVQLPRFGQAQLSPHEQSQDWVKVDSDDLALGCGNLGYKGGALAEGIEDDLAR
jgi:hypothetical protein